MNYTYIISGFAPLKKQYSGYLGEQNKPQFKADSWVFQSLFTIVHFHHCLN